MYSDDVIANIRNHLTKREIFAGLGELCAWGERVFCPFLGGGGGAQDGIMYTHLALINLLLPCFTAAIMNSFVSVYLFYESIWKMYKFAINVYENGNKTHQNKNTENA